MPPSSVPAGAIHLLKQLLVSNPVRRISLTGVLAHHWIISVTEVRLLKKLCLDEIIKHPHRYDFSTASNELLLQLKNHGVL